MPVNDIIEKHGEHIYTSHDRSVREQVENLYDVPMFDENNRHIHIYDENGFGISRRTGDAAHDMSLGILQKLDRVHTLYDPTMMVTRFDEEEEMAMMDIEGGRMIPYSIYPLAFTKTLGQSQAEGTFVQFEPVIRRINEGIVDNEMEMIEEYNNHGEVKVLQGVSSQCYNVLSHRVRDKASSHIVQRGECTTTAAGAYAEDGRTRGIAQTLLDHMQSKYPHTRWNEQIDTEYLDCSIRTEQVFVLHPQFMKEEYRKGREIYRRVMMELMGAYRHPSIRLPLRETFHVFQLDVSEGYFVDL